VTLVDDPLKDRKSHITASTKDQFVLDNDP